MVDTPLRLAVFDCDGTLVDSQHIIIEAMGQALDSCRLPAASDDSIKRVVGLSLEEAVAQILPLEQREPETVLAVCDAYKAAFQILRKDPLQTEPLFAGCREVIETLSAQGFLLAVATGKSQKGLLNTLQRHGLQDAFMSLQTADLCMGKPHPEMLQKAMADCGVLEAHCVMIGDTSYDIHMAQNAHVASIGVSWGYHPAEELEAAGANVIAEDYHDIPKLMTHLMEISV